MEEYEYLNMDLGNASNQSIYVTDLSIKVLGILNAYYIPFLVIGGFIGNGISIAMFFFSCIRVRPSSCYLGYLAVSDICFLLMLALRWINDNYYQIFNYWFFCKSVAFLTSSFSCWSVWLTVSFTTERFIAVKNPLCHKYHFSTSNRAKMIVSITGIFSFLINSYMIEFVGIYDYQGHEICELLPVYTTEMFYINFIDTTITLIFPVIIISYANFMIGRSLFEFYANHHREFVDSPTESFSKDQDSCKKRKKGIPQTLEMHIARMLFVLSTTFLILNFPSYLMRLYILYLEVKKSSISYTVIIIQQYVMLPYYTNFAVNFFLYNLSSRVFRRCVFNYIQKFWKLLSDCKINHSNLESQTDFAH